MSVQAKILSDYGLHEARDKEIEKLRALVKSLQTRQDVVPEPPVSVVKEENEIDTVVQDEGGTVEESEPQGPVEPDPPVEMMPELESLALHVPKKHRRLARALISRLEMNPNIRVDPKGYMYVDNVKSSLIFTTLFPLLFQDGQLKNKKAIRLLSILRKKNVIDKAWRKKISVKSESKRSKDWWE